MNDDHDGKGNDVTLKLLLQEAGVTQDEFARRTGLATSTIGFYVAQKKMPTLPNFLNMARELQVPLKVLARAMGLDVSGIPDDCCDEE